MESEEKTIETTISPAIQHAIANLVALCVENKTDTITLEMEMENSILEMEMNFKFIPKGSEEDGK